MWQRYTFRAKVNRVELWKVKRFSDLRVFCPHLVRYSEWTREWQWSEWERNPESCESSWLCWCCWWSPIRRGSALERERGRVGRLTMMAFFKSLTLLLLLLAIVQGKTNHESSSATFSFYPPASYSLQSIPFNLPVWLMWRYINWHKCLHWSTSFNWDSMARDQFKRSPTQKRVKNSWQGQIWTSSAESSILGVF